MRLEVPKFIWVHFTLYALKHFSKILLIHIATTRMRFVNKLEYSNLLTNLILVVAMSIVPLYT